MNDIPNLKPSRRRPDMSANSDRLPPHDERVEQSVLGCLLMDATLMDACREIQPDCFYLLSHQTLFTTMVAMRKEQKHVDIVTVCSRLKEQNQMEAVGGWDYLAALPDACIAPSFLPEYLPLLLDLATKRRLLATNIDYLARVYNGETAGDLLTSFERDALALRRDTLKDADIRTLVLEAIDEFEAAHATQGAPRGMLTGFADLDKLMNGLRVGHMIVLAARPSVGKTSLALNIAEHLAIGCKTPVGFLTAEMSPSELTNRLLCSHARVDSAKLRRGEFTERDNERLTGAAAKIIAAPIQIVDVCGCTIDQVRAKARQLVQLHGIKFLVLDYLQLLSAGGRTTNRNELVTVLSNGVKVMAKECNCPVLVLSQLNRGVDKEQREPRLSDLRDSGSVEQDADAVWLLSAKEDGTLDLLVAKQRNGPCGIVGLAFLKQFTRFESAARVDDSDIPTQYRPTTTDP